MESSFNASKKRIRDLIADNNLNKVNYMHFSKHPEVTSFIEDLRKDEDNIKTL